MKGACESLRRRQPTNLYPFWLSKTEVMLLKMCDFVVYKSCEYDAVVQLRRTEIMWCCDELTLCISHVMLWWTYVVHYSCGAVVWWCNVLLPKDFELIFAFLVLQEQTHRTSDIVRIFYIIYTIMLQFWTFICIQHIYVYKTKFQT